MTSTCSTVDKALQAQSYTLPAEGNCIERSLQLLWPRDGMGWALSAICSCLFVSRPSVPIEAKAGQHRIVPIERNAAVASHPPPFIHQQQRKRLHVPSDPIVSKRRAPLPHLNIERLSWVRIISSSRVLQGGPRLVIQLCFLVSWPYVDITKYPFNHVISEVREFFRGMKHLSTCADAPENCRLLFWLIFNFCDFFALLWVFASPFVPSNDTISAHKINCHKSFLYWNQILHWSDQIGLQLSNVGRKMEKFKYKQKIHFAIFWGMFTCTKVFIASKKFPSLTDHMVKRISLDILIRPRYKQTKLYR